MCPQTRIIGHKITERSFRSEISNARIRVPDGQKTGRETPAIPPFGALESSEAVRVGVNHRGDVLRPFWSAKPPLNGHSYERQRPRQTKKPNDAQTGRSKILLSVRGRLESVHPGMPEREMLASPLPHGTRRKGDAPTDSAILHLVHGRARRARSQNGGKELHGPHLSIMELSTGHNAVCERHYRRTA